ncbi:Crp/Fnr family transcriptional regulator [Kitasatospora sp. McL0602]|uniref:Crp/Fnr family transcriptional regulator n=1 Tax=Kitasatospora sp. McL0602 TaxID=3439530 RepID=UPI003F8C9A47
MGGQGRGTPGGLPEDAGWDDKVPYLARLDADDRAALLQLGTEQRYPARSAVLREGETSAHVLVILDGWLKVTANSGAGHEALLALRGPGDIVGESAAVNGTARSATVTALEAVRALSVREAAFASYLAQRPQAAMHLLRLVTDRLRSGDRKRLEYASCTVKQRLARLLLELAEAHGRQVDGGVAIQVPLTRSELAGSVGASREAVTRLFTELRDRELIATPGRAVVVLRPDILRRMGGY